MRFGPIIVVLGVARLASADSAPPGATSPLLRCGEPLVPYASVSAAFGAMDGPGHDADGNISSVVSGTQTAFGLRFRRCTDGIEQLELRLAGFGHIVSPAPLGGTALGLEAEANLPVRGDLRIGLHAAWASSNIVNEDHATWLSAGLRFRLDVGWAGVDLAYSTGVRDYYEDYATMSRPSARAIVLGFGFEGRGARYIAVTEAIIVGLAYLLARSYESNI